MAKLHRNVLWANRNLSWRTFFVIGPIFDIGAGYILSGVLDSVVFSCMLMFLGCQIESRETLARLRRLDNCCTWTTKKNKQTNKQKKQILARFRYFGQLLRLGSHKNKQRNQQKTNTSHTQKIGQLLRLGNHHTPYIFQPSRIYITNNKYQVMAITRHCSRVLDT